MKYNIFEHSYNNINLIFNPICMMVHATWSNVCLYLKPAERQTDELCLFIFLIESVDVLLSGTLHSSWGRKKNADERINTHVCSSLRCRGKAKYEASLLMQCVFKWPLFGGGCSESVSEAEHRGDGGGSCQGWKVWHRAINMQSFSGS